MSKILVSKIKLMLVLALVMVASAFAGMFAFSKAEAEITSVVEVNTLAIQSAELIVEGDDGINGLQFTATMSADEYESLKAKNGYEFETGIIIAPAYYEDVYGDLDLDNLFGIRGSTIIYDWANYVDGEYVYNGDKVRVVNINANDWKAGDGVYTYSGAIVDIQDHNETVLMVGTAYLKDSYGDYRIVSDNMYTSVALELEEEYADMTDDQKAWVDANWTRFTPYVAESVIVDVSKIDNNAVAVYELVDGEIGDWEYRIPGNDGLVITLTDENGNVKPCEPFDAIYFTEENLRLWTLDVSYNDVVVYTGKIDLYDSESLSFLWNDEVSMGSVAAIDYKGDDKVKTDFYTVKDGLGNYRGNAQEENIDGKDYVSFTASGDNGTWFAWKPLHSKAYYETFVGAGIELSATLMFDVSNAKNVGEPVVNQTALFGLAGPTSISANTTITESVSIDDVVANWDKYLDCGWDKQWGTRFNGGMAYVYNVHNGGKLLVSFDVEVDASAFANNGGEILVDLNGVSDLTALDLTSYMDDDHVATLNKLVGLGQTLTYEMKGYSVADEIEVTDLTAVDVSEIKNAAYVLTVKAEDVIVYEATIDLYNSTDAVVWTDSLTAENVVARQLAYDTGFPSSATGYVGYEIVDTIVNGDKTYAGSFVKFTVTEAMNIAFDVKALHTKSYYNEMIGDTTKVLFLRTFYPSAISLALNGGMNNYGMNNDYKTWRQGSASGYDNIVLSLDNNLIANDANDSFTGKWYDWSEIENLSNGRNTMVQFEIPATKASAENPFVFYVGFSASEGSIVDAGETLATAAQINGQVIDLSTETSFDLATLLPAQSQAKYKAYCAAWASATGKKAASSVGFNLTINGTVHSIVPTADGKVMLNLDDYVVATNGSVSETVKVRDLLVEGNNSVSLVAYAPPVAFMGLGSWPVTMIPTSTITIVAPAVAE